MTAIDLETTLGAVVTAHPQLARELERRHLDYCCGGARSLADACGEAGLDARAVAAELAAAIVADEPEPWTAMDPAELVDHIEAVHHRYLWREMPRLTALLERITEVHGRRHPELAGVERLFAELQADLEPHLVKEERVLFPMIRLLVAADSRPTFHCGRVTNPISVMTAEHDRAGELLGRLRAATTDYRVPADGCASYRACYEGLAELDADTRLHIHKENNVLFPAVVELEDGLPVATTL